MGYKVLHNDDALDLMGDLLKSTDIKSDIYAILHGEHYNNEFLLAVEIVDISLNGIDRNILGGFYDYEDWFREIEKKTMEDLRADAIHVLKCIQKNEDENGGWVENVKEERKQLLIRIENRLEK